MVVGTAPRDASDKLVVFQSRFDDLWRKYQTYSGGEDLFGLAVTEYPELVRTRKELNLLQKLYGLYNTVMDSINGYYDILWVEVDIEKINNELLDFQNKSVLTVGMLACAVDRGSQAFLFFLPVVSSLSSCLL